MDNNKFIKTSKCNIYKYNNHHSWTSKYNNALCIYQVDVAEKFQLLHVLKNGTKWKTYQLTTCEQLDLEQQPASNEKKLPPQDPNVNVVYINDDNIFIKTKSNLLNYVLIKASIDATNNKIKEQETIDDEFILPGEIDEDINDDDQTEILNYTHANTHLFGYSSNCHALLYGNISHQGVLSKFIYSHCIYDDDLNTFIIQNKYIHSVLVPKKYHSNFWIIVNESSLYLFESIYECYHVKAQAKLKMYSYHINEKDSSTNWRIETLHDIPISTWYNYDCYTFIRGYIVFFNSKKLDCGEIIEGIWLFDLLRKEFTKSKMKMPSDSYNSTFRAITLESESNNELIINNVIRVICEKNKDVKYPPNYLIKMILNFYQNEQIYLICTGVDYRYTDATKKFMNYQFAADILFIP